MTFFKPAFISVLFSLFTSLIYGQVGIGTTSPNASAQLDVSSTTKGFLPPRMTQAQRQDINSPTAGLMVYQTDGTAGLWYYTGNAWIYIINSTSATLPVSNGGTGTTTGSITGTGALTFTAGGTNQNVTLTPSGSGRTILNGNVGIGTASPSSKLDVIGNVNVTGNLIVGSSSGDEGGELHLATAQTNTTLTGSHIITDIYQNRLRIFENGGNYRGVQIDLSKAPASIAGELIWKASGIVNAGTFITLDNIKATVTTSYPRGLSLATVSGSFSANIGGTFSKTSNNIGGMAATIIVNTTASNSIFSWDFPGQADTSTYILNDITNNRAYRITLLIGGSYNNNFISIERLH
jgi:hypothetical protein